MENRATTVIVLLIIIVIGLSGYVLYMSNDYSTKNNNADKVNKNSGVIDKVDKNNDKNEENIEEYDLDKAKELVNPYIIDITEANIFEEGLTEYNKSVLAIFNNTSTFESSLTCKEIYKDKAVYDKEFGTYIVNDMMCNDNSDRMIISPKITYNTLNSKYQELFGSKINIPQKDINLGLCNYDYNEENNLYIGLCIIGGIEDEDIYVYDIKNATKKGNTLYIDYGYARLKPNQYGNYTVNINNNDLSYTMDQVYDDNGMNESFKQSLVEQYLNDMDTYEFIFKLDNTRYVLDSINKIN